MFLFALTSPPAASPATVPDRTDRNRNKVVCNDLLVKLQSYRFGSFHSGGSADATKWRRNEVIDALIAISNDKCGTYSAHLKTFDGQTNGALSVASILTGGVGGIVTGADAARALSGTSAVISGSRVAINDSWFSSQTIHVLVAAFEKARERQRREIGNRQQCPLTYYTLNRGIGDAMKYHATCSILAGLAETASAVERTDQPGLDTMRRQLADLASIREQADRLVNASVPIDSPTTRNKQSYLTKANDRLQKLLDEQGEAFAALEAARAKYRSVNVANPQPTDDVIDGDISVAPVKAVYTSFAARVAAADKDYRDSQAAYDKSLATDEALSRTRRTTASDLPPPTSQAAVCPFQPTQGADTKK